MDSFFKIMGALFLCVLVIAAFVFFYASYYNKLDKECTLICKTPGQVDHSTYGSDKCYCVDSNGNLVLKKVFE